MSLFRKSFTFRRLNVAVAAVLLASLGKAGLAQTEPLTATARQLQRIDLGVSAQGVITRSTTGPDSLLGNIVTDSPSSTVGALISLRYTKSPLVGFEFNYTYARFAQDYTLVPVPFNVQANASEYTVGWVFHTPKIFGIGTFASAGGGTTAFKPSNGGGEGFKEQARATYYYNVGLEQQVFMPNLGLRAGFRQAFYNAPDFETNYLANHRRTFSTEPNIGLYLRF